MKNLINSIANYFGYTFTEREEFREIIQKAIKFNQLTSELITKFSARHLLKKIQEAEYKQTGVFKTENSQYVTFGNQTETLLIQIHSEGDIAKVYRAINENNFDELIKKIVEPNVSLDEAKNEIQEAHRDMFEIISKDFDSIIAKAVAHTALKRLDKAIVKLRDLG